MSKCFTSANSSTETIKAKEDFTILKKTYKKKISNSSYTVVRGTPG